MAALKRRQTTIAYEKAARLISDHPVPGIFTLPSVTALFDPVSARPLFFSRGL